MFLKENPSKRDGIVNGIRSVALASILYPRSNMAAFLSNLNDLISKKDYAEINKIYKDLSQKVKGTNAITVASGAFPLIKTDGEHFITMQTPILYNGKQIGETVPVRQVYAKTYGIAMAVQPPKGYLYFASQVRVAGSNIEGLILQASTNGSLVAYVVYEMQDGRQDDYTPDAMSSYTEATATGVKVGAYSTPIYSHPLMKPSNFPEMWYRVDGVSLTAMEPDQLPTSLYRGKKSKKAAPTPSSTPAPTATPTSTPAASAGGYVPPKALTPEEKERELERRLIIVAKYAAENIDEYIAANAQQTIANIKATAKKYIKTFHYDVLRTALDYDASSFELASDTENAIKNYTIDLGVPTEVEVTIKGTRRKVKMTVNLIPNVPIQYLFGVVFQSDTKTPVGCGMALKGERMSIEIVDKYKNDVKQGEIKVKRNANEYMVYLVSVVNEDTLPADAITSEEVLKEQEEEQRLKEEMAKAEALKLAQGEVITVNEPLKEDLNYLEITMKENDRIGIAFDFATNVGQITSGRLREIYNMLTGLYKFKTEKDARLYFALLLSKNPSILLKGVPATGKTTLITLTMLLMSNPLRPNTRPTADGRMPTYRDALDLMENGDTPLLGIATHNPDKKPAELLYNTDITTEERIPKAKSTKMNKPPLIEWTEMEVTKKMKYIIEPRPRAIVSAPIKFNNEANRMRPDVQDAMLSLIEENRVEYMGKVLDSPPDSMHFFDYNPHLEMEHPLDWAFLDRINISMYLPVMDFSAKYSVLTKSTSKGSKRLEEQAFDAIASQQVNPLTYTELHYLQNYIDKQVEVTPREYAFANMFQTLFEVATRLYSDEYKNMAYEIYGDNPPMMPDPNDPTKMVPIDVSSFAYLDLSKNAYGQQAAEGKVNDSLPTNEFNVWSILYNMHRPLGFRALKSMIKVYKAMKFVKMYVFGEKWGAEVAYDTFLQILPHVAEHRISQEVEGDIKIKFMNFGDVIEQYIAPEFFLREKESMIKMAETYVLVIENINKKKYATASDAELAFLKTVSGLNDADRTLYASDPLLQKMGISLYIYASRTGV